MKATWSITVIQVVLTVAVRAQYCPYRWEPWGDNCLDLSELNNSTGNQARLQCQDIGGSLAIVEDQIQDGYLKDKLSLGNMTAVPLGCTNDDEDSTWTCLAKDDEEWFWYNSTQNAGFWNWAPGQPDNDPNTSGRIFLNMTSKWTDEYRDDQRRDMLVACLTRTTADEFMCPRSWQVVDNKCVYFIVDFVERPRAVRTVCEDLGGSMLTIDSKKQNDVITDKLVDSGLDAVVLGCNDQGDEGYWRCDDRVYPYMVHWTKEAQTGFWGWGVDEPAEADPEADCAILRPNGNWEALPCTEQYTMLLTCEHEPTTMLCPSGYEPWIDVCLHMSSFTGTAAGAKDECLSMGGGRLLVIDNEGQNTFLQNELVAPTNQMAIACSDEAEEGTWICDGKNTTEWYWNSTDNDGYWNWKPDEPISGRENNCMYLYRKAGNYRSEPCDELFDMMLACTIDPVDELPTTSGFTKLLTTPHTSLPTTSHTREPTVPTTKSTAKSTAVFTTKAANPTFKVTTDVPVLCPSGYEPWVDDCLHMSSFTGTVAGAKEKCLSIGGGRLLVIENEEQNTFLQNELAAPINQMAIACSDEAEEGTWICDDKDTTEWYWNSTDSDGYWNWKPDGEPISGRENNCMYLYRKAGNYRSEPCDESFDMMLACTIDPVDGIPKPQGGLSTGGIVGIVIATIAIIAVAAVAIAYVFLQRNQRGSGSLVKNHDQDLTEY